MKKAASILAILLVTTVADAQFIYRLQYQLSQVDTSLCDALLVLDEIGTGVARVKQSASDSIVILTHFNLEEYYPVEVGPDKESTEVFYKTASSTVVKGGANAKSMNLLFSFTKDAATGLYQPSTLSLLNAGDTISISPASIELIDQEQLDEKFVLTYFTRNDEFYRNLFAIRSRSLTPSEQNTRMYLLAVASTVDSAIAPSCRKDIALAVEMFSRIAKFLGIGIVPTILAGSNSSKQQLESSLKSLQPANNDIVVFYYSGHGFRKPKVNSRFPFIDLRMKNDATYMTNSMNIEDVYNTIVAKGGRLNLVIADCCNTHIDATNVIAPPPPRTKGREISWSMNNCQALFMNPARKSYLVTAADVDQKASSNNAFGGFFSYFFRTSLESQFSLMKIGASWDQVLADTKRQTVKKASRTFCAKPYIKANICQQYPVWKQL